MLRTLLQIRFVDASCSLWWFLINVLYLHDLTYLLAKATTPSSPSSTITPPFLLVWIIWLVVPSKWLVSLRLGSAAIINPRPIWSLVTAATTSSNIVPLTFWTATSTSSRPSMMVSSLEQIFFHDSPNVFFEVWTRWAKTVRTSSDSMVPHRREMAGKTMSMATMMSK